jgi:hypothetical protein
MMGPKAKIFISKIWLGDRAFMGRIKHFKATLYFPLRWALCGLLEGYE